VVPPQSRERPVPAQPCRQCSSRPGSGSTRLRRFGSGGSTIDSGPLCCFCQTQPPPRFDFGAPVSLQCKVGFWDGSDAII
jgi:hypothetical protein